LKYGVVVECCEMHMRWWWLKYGVVVECCDTRMCVAACRLLRVVSCER
jgi:hypothetical protein